ncbi:MAG TPA: AtpZ/AtpI family protein [Chlorobiota bacterium]|nr:AtpZ/AtpI family protein [Chlorobiota bacterium]
MRTPADDAKKNSRSQSSVARQLAPYLALGSQLAASVLLPGGIGWYADKQLGTTPWLLVGGLVLGSVVGFVQFFRSVSQLTRSDTKRTKSRNI